RDARNGMPQLKIAHLRATPSPPDARLVAELARAGAELSSRNDGVHPNEQERIDREAARPFGLTEPQWERVRASAASLPPRRPPGFLFEIARTIRIGFLSRRSACILPSPGCRFSSANAATSGGGSSSFWLRSA